MFLQLYNIYIMWYYIKYSKCHLFYGYGDCYYCEMYMSVETKLEGMYQNTLWLVALQMICMFFVWEGTGEVGLVFEHTWLL